jgi:hypothetical protein
MFFIEVLLESADESESDGLGKTCPLASWQLDGMVSAFRIPSGILQPGFGPYCIRVTAEACGKQASGVSATFFTKSRPKEVAGLDTVHPTSSPSQDEPLAEPPSADETSLGASPWLGAGWEEAFVVQATAPFEPTASDMLLVRKGDSIQVLEQHNTGWTYCKNLSMRLQSSEQCSSGWVPDWVVQVKKKGRGPSKVKTVASK